MRQKCRSERAGNAVGDACAPAGGTTLLCGIYRKPHGEYVGSTPTQSILMKHRFVVSILGLTPKESNGGAAPRMSHTLHRAQRNLVRGPYPADDDGETNRGDLHRLNEAVVSEIRMKILISTAGTKLPQ